jgi:hypothetical protein
MRWQHGPDCRQNTRPDQGRQIMHDIFLTPQIAQLQHHPPHDAAAREDLTKNHRTRIPRACCSKVGTGFELLEHAKSTI